MSDFLTPRLRDLYNSQVRGYDIPSKSITSSKQLDEADLFKNLKIDVSEGLELILPKDPKEGDWFRITKVDLSDGNLEGLTNDAQKILSVPESSAMFIRTGNVWHTEPENQRARMTICGSIDLLNPRTEIEGWPGLKDSLNVVVTGCDRDIYTWHVGSEIRKGVGRIEFKGGAAEQVYLCALGRPHMSEVGISSTCAVDLATLDLTGMSAERFVSRQSFRGIGSPPRADLPIPPASHDHLPRDLEQIRTTAIWYRTVPGALPALKSLNDELMEGNVANLDSSQIQTFAAKGNRGLTGDFGPGDLQRVEWIESPFLRNVGGDLTDSYRPFLRSVHARSTNFFIDAERCQDMLPSLQSVNTMRVTGDLREIASHPQIRNLGGRFGVIADGRSRLDGAGVVGPMLEVIGEFEGRLASLPTDYSRADSLTLIEERGTTLYDEGMLDAAVASMYYERGRLDGLIVETNEGVEYREDDSDRYRYASTMSRDALNQVAGLGAYKEDGLIDAGIDYRHPGIWRQSASVVDSITLRVSLPALNHIRRDEAGTYQIEVQQGSGSVWINLFEVGAPLRLIASDNSDVGHYEIASSSYDMQAQEATITVSGGTLPASMTDGEMVYVRWWPRP